MSRWQRIARERLEEQGRRTQSAKWRDVKSAWADKMRYDVTGDGKGDVYVKFNDGHQEVYKNVTQEDWNKVIHKDKQCVTDGSNKWGSWHKGKPSHGAGIHQVLHNYSHNPV